MPLLKSQIPHAEAILAALSQYGSAVDLSDAGTGKTYVACHVAKELGLMPYVVCPKSIVPGWERKSKDCEVVPYRIVNYEKLQRDRCLKFHKYRLTKWPKYENCLLIFDEAHRVSGEKTKNAAMAAGAKASGNKVLLLSASLADSPKKMRAPGYILGLHKWYDYWKWLEHYGVSQDPNLGCYVWDGSPEHMERLHDLIIPSRGSRLTVDQIEHFPEVEVNSVPVHVGEKVRVNQLVSELEEQVETHLIQRAHSLVEIGLKDAGCELDGFDLVLSGKTRELLEKLKLPNLEKQVRRSLDQGNSVIVFLNFIESVGTLKKKFPQCGVISGKEKSREQTIEAFEKNELRLLIVSIAAGSEGLDLHDLDGGYPRVSFISPNWSARLMKQVFGRTARVGARSRVVLNIVFAQDSKEEQVYQSVMGKIFNMEVFNNGRAEPSTREESMRQEKEITTITSLEQTQDREHAPYSPSKLGYLAVCSGYRSSDIPNKFAARGELGHKAVEIEDISIIPALDQELKDAAKVCIDYKRSLLDGATQLYQEEKLDYLDQWGYLDTLIIKGDVAMIVDWKFTRNPYYANSAQFWAYSVAVWESFEQVESILVKVPHPFRDEIDEEEFTRKEHYLKFKGAVAAIIQKARKDQFKDRVFSENCTYCSRLATCSVVATTYRDLLEVYNEKRISIPDAPELHASDESLDSDGRGSLQTIAKLAEQWAKEVKYHNTEAARNGEDIKGYRLADRKGSSVVFNINAALQVLSKDLKLKINPEDFLEGVELSKTKFLNACLKEVPDQKKKDLMQDIENFMEDNGLLLEKPGSTFLTKDRSRKDQT